MQHRFAAAAAAFCLCQSALAVDDEAAVVVTATRMPSRASELLNDVTVLHRDDIEASAAASLPELLAAQPGVQFTTNGGPGKTAGLFLRGAESRHTVVLIDGMRVNSATAGDTAIQHIPLDQIERIEIVRGPVSSLYGSEAIGGVVQIFTKRGDGPLTGNLQAGVGSRNTSDVSAGISGSTADVDYALTAGHFQTDGVSASTSTAYNQDQDGYRQDNAAGRIGIRYAAGQELAAQFFYSDGVTRYDPSASSYDARIYQTLQAAGVESRNQIADFWRSTLRLADSADDSTNHSSATAKSVFKTEQRQTTWQNDFRTSIGNLLAGIERLEQSIAGTTNYATKDRSVDSLLLGYQGHYADHRLQASARRDDNSQFGTKSTGMAYYGYQITPALRASVGAGTSFSAPTFNQLYFPSNWGNPNLEPEEGRNKEATLAWDNGHAHASLTWFDNRVRNLINYNTSTTPYYKNINRAHLTGWTLAVDGNLLGWRPRLAYDWLDAKDEATGLMLPRRAKERLTLGLARELDAWTVSGDLVASSSRLDYSSPSSIKRLGGYTVANAGIDYRAAAQTTLFVRADNIFDKRYELAADYATTRASIFAGVRQRF